MADLEDDNSVNNDDNPTEDLAVDDDLEGEVAADVARSDALDVTHAEEEADLDGQLSPLPCSVRASSALSITKVSLLC